MGYLRYHSDANGNVTFLLDNDGTVVEKYTYDAFGRPKIMGPGPDGEVRTLSHYGNRFLFQGREYIGEVGVYDYRNRFYHPALGRFLQKDPTGFDAGDMNLFRYCGDDPVDGSDPTGLMMTESSWDRLMHWQGHSPYSFNAILEDQRNQAGPDGGGGGGNHESKSISRKDEGKKTEGSDGDGRKAKLVSPRPMDAQEFIAMTLPMGKGVGALKGLRGVFARLFARSGTRYIDDVLGNPWLLKGKTPAEVTALARNAPGWRAETLSQGTHAGQGLILRQYTASGTPTGRMIRWHPGGGHHGPKPYWRTTSGEGGISEIIPGAP